MQTTVNTVPTIGVAGLLSDADRTKRAISVVNEEASAEFPFGIMLAKGTTPAQAKLLAANTDKLKGILIFGHAYHKDLEVGDTGLKPKMEGAALVRGLIWVLTEGTTPVEGDQVHVRAVATGSEQAGAFRAAKDGTDTIDLTPFARWTGRTGTGIAELYIDLVNAALATADS